jgi:hypothetical protein
LERRRSDDETRFLLSCPLLRIAFMNERASELGAFCDMFGTDVQGAGACFSLMLVIVFLFSFWEAGKGKDTRLPKMLKSMKLCLLIFVCSTDRPGRYSSPSHSILSSRYYDGWIEQ